MTQPTATLPVLVTTYDDDAAAFRVDDTAGVMRATSVLAEADAALRAAAVGAVSGTALESRDVMQTGSQARHDDVLRLTRGVDLGPFDVGDNVDVYFGGEHDAIWRTHGYIDAGVLGLMVPHEVQAQARALTQLPGPDGEVRADVPADTLEYEVSAALIGGDDDVVLRWNVFAAPVGAKMWSLSIAPQIQRVLSQVPLARDVRLDAGQWGHVAGWGPAVYATLTHGEEAEYTYALGVDGPGWVLRVTATSSQPINEAVIDYVADIMAMSVVNVDAALGAELQSGDPYPMRYSA